MPSISPTRFEQSPGLIIVGLNRHYAPGTESEIPHQWEEFIPRMESIPQQVAGITYGVCTAFDPVDGLDYLSGVEVTGAFGIPDGMERIELPPRAYAVFTHEGHYSLLPQTFAAIVGDWAPVAGNADFSAPSFERYNAEFNPETGCGGTEVWIPLTAS